jgi:signal transduction histidine kinase
MASRTDSSRTAPRDEPAGEPPLAPGRDEPVSQPAAGPPRASARDAPLRDGALAVAAFAASVALLAVGESEEGDGLGAFDVALAALASLPLVAWRRAPLAVFVATALASSLLYAVADPDGPPIGPTVAVYLLAFSSDGSRARTRLTLAAVAAMLTVHVVAGGILGAEILFGITVWGGAWLAGDRTRLRRERMAELEERALRAEREAERERRLAAAEERGRIARDLHDSAGHAINVILVHAGMGRLQVDRDPERAREAFATIEEVARETVGEIDELVRVLRDDGPGEVEPPAGLASLDGLVQRHRAAGLDVTVAIRGTPRPLPAGVDRGAYRILQEALTNAARHGGGDAGVQVAFTDAELHLEVENGLDAAQPDGAEGGKHGLIGMRERAALLGGSVQADRRGGRFVVRARLPIPAEQATEPPEGAPLTGPRATIPEDAP